MSKVADTCKNVDKPKGEFHYLEEWQRKIDARKTAFTEAYTMLRETLEEVEEELQSARLHGASILSELHCEKDTSRKLEEDKKRLIENWHREKSERKELERVVAEERKVQEPLTLDDEFSIEVSHRHEEDNDE